MTTPSLPASPGLGSLLASRPQRLALLLGALGMLAIGFFPLFAGPGYELSLAAGLILPALASIATAYECSRAPIEPMAALLRGMRAGALLSVAAVITALAHAARAGPCDLPGGLALLFLGPALGAMLGGAWGGTVGSAAKALPGLGVINAALLLAPLAPAAGVAISIWRFLSSPMVFAFDPFFGFFAGPIYETVIEPAARLLTYRAGTVLTLGAAVIALSQFRQSPRGWRWVGGGHPALLVLGAGAALSSAAVTVYGSSLGHFSTPDSIRHELGSETSHGRCTVLHSAVIERREAELLARDCQAHLRALEKYFGARGPDRVTVYLFASPEEKARLMGAAATEIAKPWRAEVYLTRAPYPHSVLGHELAHVVAGAFGRGPFRIAGAIGGLLPNPGLIEGVAVAASPSPHQALTPEQWAAAMQQLGLLPPLDTVFSLDFFGQSSQRAYTVAGAFLGWIRERYGPKALRAWYSGAELPSLTRGLDLPALERLWHEELRGVSIDAPALEQARVVFSRPSVFGRRCPHVVDREEREGYLRLGWGDVARARAAFERVLELDPSDVSARLAIGSCAMRQGDAPGARRLYSEVASDPRLAALERGTGEENLADVDLWQKKLDSARRRYAGIEATVFSPDRLRQLTIKRQVRSEVERQAVTTLLLGDRLGFGWPSAVADLEAWAQAEPEQGTAQYLLAKNFYNDGQWERASRYLDAALDRTLTSPLIEREAYRVRMAAACALGDLAAARKAYAGLARDPDLGRAQRRSLAGFADRCGIEGTLGRQPARR